MNNGLRTKRSFQWNCSIVCSVSSCCGVNPAFNSEVSSWMIELRRSRPDMVGSVYYPTIVRELFPDRVNGTALPRRIATKCARHHRWM
jgi:hypothetical protein